jgi:frataxin
MDVFLHGLAPAFGAPYIQTRRRPFKGPPAAAKDATTMAIDESAFHAAADRTLRAFLQAIEDRLGDAVEADLRDGILTLEMESGAKYVINKHAPNRQIWLASPVSGASHYGYDPARDQWLSTRGQGTLADVLASELAKVTGTAIAFD